MIPFLLSALLLTDVVVPPAPPAPAVVIPAKPKKEGKICRVPSVQTGTRMQRRVCRTASEWAMFEEGRSAEDLKTMGSN